MKKFNSQAEMVSFIQDKYEDTYGMTPLNIIKKILNEEGFLERGLEYDINSTLLDANVIEKVKSYVINYDENKKQGTGLYIFGDLGVGKTTLATIACHEVFKKRLGNLEVLDVSCITFSELLQVCRDKMKNYADRLTYNKLIKCDLVMVDNLGNEYQWKSEEAGNFASSQFDEFLKQRTGNNRPTIITSNIKPEELGEKYGQVIQDLIYSNCMGINVDSGSIRIMNNKMEML